MLRLYMLVSLTWFFKAYTIYRNEKSHAHETANLVLIKDCAHNGSRNIRKITEFQADLCEWNKPNLHSTHLIQICSYKYRTLPLCNVSSTLVTKSGGTWAEGCTDPTQQKSYLKAFSKAVQLAQDASAGKRIIVFLSDRKIDCDFYGVKPTKKDHKLCGRWCTKWFGCMRSVELADLKTQYTEQAVEALNKLLKHFVVIILRIVRMKHDEMKSWAKKANNSTGQIHYTRLNSYKQLNEKGISFVKSVISMALATTVQPAVASGKLQTSAINENGPFNEKELMSPKLTVATAMIVSEPTPTEIVASILRMTTTTVVQANLTSQERVEQGSGQLKWWMILLICCLGLGVILVIPFSILLVMRLKKRAASRTYPPGDKTRPSKLWKPKDLPDSLATNAIDPVSCPTYDKTKTLPSNLMQGESTMSHDGDHCSSQFPSGITLPDV